MYRHARRDSIEKKISEYLRRCGASVLFIDDAGAPDLLVGYNNFSIMLEIKMPKGKLTTAQVAFFNTFKGAAYVVRSIHEAKLILKHYAKFNVPKLVEQQDSTGLAQTPETTVVTGTDVPL